MCGHWVNSVSQIFFISQWLSNGRLGIIFILSSPWAQRWFLIKVTILNWRFISYLTNNALLYVREEVDTSHYLPKLLVHTASLRGNQASLIKSLLLYNHEMTFHPPRYIPCTYMPTSGHIGPKPLRDSCLVRATLQPMEQKPFLLNNSRAINSTLGRRTFGKRSTSFV